MAGCLVITLPIFSLLILLISLSAAGIQIHGPENIAVVTGNPVTMSCGTNKFPPILHWYFLGVVENDEILIFNGLQG